MSEKTFSRRDFLKIFGASALGAAMEPFKPLALAAPNRAPELQEERRFDAVRRFMDTNEYFIKTNLEGLGLRPGDVEPLLTEKPLNGAFYFYWFDKNNHTDVTVHFPDTTEPSYPEVNFMNKAWHKRQLLECMIAGFDFIMLADWYIADNRNDGDNHWARDGLKVFVEAYQELNEELTRNGEIAGIPGLKLPKIAQLHDTLKYKREIMDETGSGNTDGIDGTTPHGAAHFQQPIRDFWSYIPKEFWAVWKREENGPNIPLILVYEPAFKDRNNDGVVMDAETIQIADTLFKEMFGDSFELNIIYKSNWKNRGDVRLRSAIEESYEWGASLNGPNQFSGKKFNVMSVGPGFSEAGVLNDVEGRHYQGYEIDNFDTEPTVRETWDGGPPRYKGRHYGKTLIDGAIYQLQHLRGDRDDIRLYEVLNECHEANNLGVTSEFGWDYVILMRLINIIAYKNKENGISQDISRLEAIKDLIDEEVAKDDDLGRRPLTRALIRVINGEVPGYNNEDLISDQKQKDIFIKLLNGDTDQIRMLNESLISEQVSSDQTQQIDQSTQASPKKRLSFRRLIDRLFRI